jgi:hypothetical protein
MSSNICAIYSHNTGAPNGQIIFNDLVLEQNNIAAYFYDSFPGMISPIVFNGIWQEANGVASSAGMLQLSNSPATNVSVTGSAGTSSGRRWRGSA